MIYRILRSFRFLTQALTAESAAERISMGVAMGILIGLVPKGNLLCLCFVVLAFVVRINLLAVLVTTAVASFAAFVIEPALHEIGYGVLSISSLQPLFASLYDTPWIPWTRFNNTVVMGGLLIGLVQLLPTYFTLTPWIRRCQPNWSRRARNSRWGRELLGDQVTTSWRVG